GGERGPCIADVRVRHQPEDAPRVALDLQYEGRVRLLRLPAGIPPAAACIGAQAGGRTRAAMTKVATWLLTAGALLFIGVLASQGLPAVLSALAAAGWGLVLVASFHLLPLVLDAA